MKDNYKLVGAAALAGVLFAPGWWKLLALVGGGYATIWSMTSSKALDVEKSIQSGKAVCRISGGGVL